jgi:hypothetical protein
MNSSILQDISSYGKSAQGRKEYVAYLKGGRLNLRQAILAHCYSCTNLYADGKEDCQMLHCPLYPFMPYGEGAVKVKRERTERQKKQSLRLAHSRSAAARS